MAIRGKQEERKRKKKDKGGKKEGAKWIAIAALPPVPRRSSFKLAQQLSGSGTPFGRGKLTKDQNVRAVAGASAGNLARIEVKSTIKYLGLHLDPR